LENCFSYNVYRIAAKGRRNMQGDATISVIF
jgi:hypothetical protein